MKHILCEKSVSLSYNCLDPADVAMVLTKQLTFWPNYTGINSSLYFFFTSLWFEWVLFIACWKLRFLHFFTFNFFNESKNVLSWRKKPFQKCDKNREKWEEEKTLLISVEKVFL